MKSKDKIQYCKCGGKLALCQTFINSVTKDQEPYRNGFREGDEGEIELDGCITLTVHICEKCKHIESAQIENDFQ